MMGQGIRMGGRNAMADALDPATTRGEVDEMEQYMTGHAHPSQP